MVSGPARHAVHTYSTCSSCGSSIEWAVFVKSGKPVPLDLGEFDLGNLEVVGRHETGVVVVRVLPKAELELARETGRGLRRTHFASCPHAARHRRPRSSS